MNFHEITKLTWKRLVFSVVAVLAAGAFRAWPLYVLENKVVWLTFYPAVMVVALYSGLIGGTIATLTSCALVVFAWPLFVDKPFMQGFADWLSMGVFVFTCIMITVVSEAMRQSNQRAIRLQHQAQRANDAKSSFLASMSHELRTPLNAILGYSQILQKDEAISDEQRGYIKTINTSGTHLLELINDILEIAKIESRKAVLHAAPFSTHKIVQELKAMFTLPFETENLSLTIVVKDTVPPYLVGDALKLKMILINLIGNALKFTETGGVTVVVDAQEISDSSQISLSIMVEDTGIGIPDHELHRLFKVFSQTESGISAQSGTGLGLAISQEYAHLMGSEIQVASTVGVGTRFSFILTLEPYADVVPEDAHQPRRIVGIAGDRPAPKILVVDDDEVNLALLVKILSDAKLDVDEARSGAEAVEQFSLHHHALVWMDIRMSGMDGLEATRKIRALESADEREGRSAQAVSDAPEGAAKAIIVALSAHVFEEEKGVIFAAGMDDFLGKPYLESDVFELMAKHLGLQYVYAPASDCAVVDEKRDDTPTSGHAGSASGSIKLTLLDSRLRVNLHNAILLLDSDAINQAVQEIKLRDFPLGDELERLAQDMNYDKIWDLLESE